MKTTRYFEEQVLRKRPYLDQASKYVDLSQLEATSLPVQMLALG